MAHEATVDIDKLSAKLDNMSEDQLREELLKITTQRKITQKKYYNPETAKRAREKRAAQIKDMEERAKQTKSPVHGFANLYEYIKSEASQRADAALGTQEADTATDDE